MFPPNFVPTQFVDARGGIVNHGILKLDSSDPQLCGTASSEKHVFPSWVGTRLAKIVCPKVGWAYVCMFPPNAGTANLARHIPTQL